VVAKHCAKTGNQCYQVWAEDTSQDRSDLSMETKLAIAEQKDKDTSKLPASIQIAIRMKAMVLLNIVTEGDIANSTQGEIHNIILDQREEVSEPNKDSIMQLKYSTGLANWLSLDCHLE
jgi:hypothetical protein